MPRSVTDMDIFKNLQLIKWAESIRSQPISNRVFKEL